MANKNEEEMTVTIDLDDGTTVTCEVVTIFEAGGKDYIALYPLTDNDDDEVWIYGYSENENDSNEEPELIFIEDDEEYERASDAFDEWLDDQQFEDINE